MTSDSLEYAPLRGRSSSESDMLRAIGGHGPPMEYANDGGLVGGRLRRVREDSRREEWDLAKRRAPAAPRKVASESLVRTRAWTKEMNDPNECEGPRTETVSGG